MKTQSAFTLIELLVTLSVVAILATVALPKLQYVIVSNRMTTKTNELVGSINFARGEAITRTSQTFTIEALDAAQWGKGWKIVKYDTAKEPKIIKIFEFKEDQILIQEKDSLSSISFLARGRLREEYAFYICSEGHLEGRIVEIKTVGRASVERCSFSSKKNACTNPFDCS